MDLEHKTMKLDIPSERVREFCRKWGVREFALFGSVLREDFGPGSDVDVLVTFAADATPSLFDHVDMEEELAELFGRPVDVVSRGAVEQSQNPFRRRSILESARVIYAAA
jgi:predicted nucleotidyltransferase